MNLENIVRLKFVKYFPNFILPRNAKNKQKKYLELIIQFQNALCILLRNSIFGV